MMKELDVREWIVTYLADILDMPVPEIRFDETFMNYGLDSADAVIIGGALEEQFDVEVDATVFLRNETIDDLIDDLRRSELLE